MAAITPVIVPFSSVEIGAGIKGGGLKVTWSSLTENDTAEAWDGGVMYPNKSAQVEGLTAGDIVVIEGSNDESGYLTLTDKQGGDMSFLTSDGLKTIEENTRLIRPRVSAGTSVSADITLFVTQEKERYREVE